MTIKRFEDLIVWQKAQDLAYKIFSVFSKFNNYDFRSQIQRAALSVSNNIAEGFGRYSDTEFSRFLIIARGSCYEVRSMLYLALRLGSFEREIIQNLINDTNEIGRLINGLKRTLKSK